jgi:sialate O-acetylesterase
MKTRIITSLAVSLLIFCPQVNAKIRLPQIMSDNMVLQQNTKARLWGWATPGETIKVKCSWYKIPVTATASADSSWTVSVPTPKGSYTKENISFSGIQRGKSESIALKNILIGEVWFASGQSNMEMPMNGFTNCPVGGANEEIVFAGQYKDKIHFVTVPKIATRTPQKETEGKWNEASPKNTSMFSATGWFFATTMNKVLNVPIGVINCSWGGSIVEGWIKESTLKTYPDIDLSKIEIDKNRQVFYKAPLVMYNGMAFPLEKYTVKGFLWYQGESNTGREKTYADRLATLIKQMRDEWKLGDLPFYYVEIAPFNYGGHNSGALLREAQYKVQYMVPNAGMISTNDLVEDYELNQIHPHNKKAVGERLAFMALNNTYGMKSVACRGLEYESMKADGNKIELRFKGADNGFNRSTGIIGFEIAGSDKVFHPADVNVGRGSVTVSSPDVAQPVAVRYGFKDFQPGNFGNTRGLPLVPFRTDNW